MCLCPKRREECLSGVKVKGILRLLCLSPVPLQSLCIAACPLEFLHWL